MHQVLEASTSTSRSTGNFVGFGHSRCTITSAVVSRLQDELFELSRSTSCGYRLTYLVVQWSSEAGGTAGDTFVSSSGNIL